MLCRSLRNLRWSRLALSLALCLALIGGIATLPSAWPEDETPSLTIRTYNFPLTALAANSGLRIERQAQPHRLSFPKPGHSARLTSIARPAAPNPRTQANRAYRAFPRRLLHPGHLKPRSPDDPGSPLLS